MEAVGEVERHGAFGEIDDVAFGGIDEDFVGEEVEFEFFAIDFFAAGKFGASFLEFFDPEQVGGELGDFAFEVGVADFLFVVMEGGGETAFGVIVHLLGADLKFDHLFFGGDDGGVEGLIAVLFGGGNVIFDAAVERGEERMDKP